MAQAGSESDDETSGSRRAVRRASTHAVPTIGALVRARGDVWMATAVQPAHAPNGHPQHLVRLLSVSEDRHGETAELIWQVEADAQVLDAIRLPEPALTLDSQLAVDDPRTLDA